MYVEQKIFLKKERYVTYYIGNGIWIVYFIQG